MSGAPREKKGLHPRNPHRSRYDFPKLVGSVPALGKYVQRSPVGSDTIDFTDAAAVMELNRALLRTTYGIKHWTFPAGYLCPPIPGRADYIHHLADLLAGEDGKQPPRGPAVRILEIGVGANCIHPIIGRYAYGWQFVGTEIDPIALASARRIVDRIRCCRATSSVGCSPTPPEFLPA